MSCDIADALFVLIKLLCMLSYLSTRRRHLVLKLECFHFIMYKFFDSWGLRRFNLISNSCFSIFSKGLCTCSPHEFGTLDIKHWDVGSGFFECKLNRDKVEI